MTGTPSDANGDACTALARILRAVAYFADSAVEIHANGADPSTSNSTLSTLNDCAATVGAIVASSGTKSDDDNEDE